MLWSLCSEHARGQVVGDDWRFPYSGKVKATEQRGGQVQVTGPIRGPMDQTFTLTCVYRDVTAKGATLVNYTLL